MPKVKLIETPAEIADDQCIDCRMELLKDIADDHGDGKEDDQLHDRSVRHIRFCFFFGAYCFHIPSLSVICRLLRPPLAGSVPVRRYLIVLSFLNEKKNSKK